jgi:hypothetical protein
MTGRIYAEPPLWTDGRFGLTREDGQLVAIDLDTGWRWGVRGARSVEDGEVAPVIAAAGHVVAIGDQVIDVAEHRVVLEGRWVIHGVHVGGGAFVTTPVDGVSWTIGPVRLVEPPEPEAEDEDDEDDDYDDDD